MRNEPDGNVSKSLIQPGRDLSTPDPLSSKTKADSKGAPPASGNSGLSFATSVVCDAAYWEDRTLGQRYRVKRCLRATVESATLLATDTQDNSDVIVQLGSQSLVPAGAQMRLEHETKRLAFIKSSWLQSPKGFGIDGPWLYVVTPFLAGETLADRNRRGPRVVTETLAIAAGLFSALIDVHRAGALHRAVNPGHVVYCSSGGSRVKLTGFGLSAAVIGSASTEMSDAVRYFSPEQAGLLDRDLGPTTDLYSAGVVLFECLAGRPPYEADEISQLLLKQMTSPVPGLRGLGIDVPRALDDVLQRLLRKDPRDRYQSAEAVLADIRSLRQSLRRGVRDPKIIVGSRDRRGTLTEPIFVGREREQQTLDKQIQRTCKGLGGLIFIESESGGGKTRLLTELAERATAGGCTVYRGRASWDGTPHPVEAFETVVSQRAIEAAGCPLDAKQLQAKLQRDCPILGPLYPKLAKSLGWAENAPELRAEQNEADMIAALSRMLDALGTAERPAIVLLDDGQWMDELTLKALVHWFSSPTPERQAKRHVGIVVAFRSEDVTRESILRRVRPSAHLDLLPLEDPDIDQLTESMAGPLPTQVKTLICRLSHGSPFMATAVLHGLIESRKLVREPNGWRIESVGAGDLQSSTHAAEFLKRRLGLLPDRVTQFLTMGAILGKEFNLRIAADLAGISSDSAISTLDEARRRHLLWVRPDGSRCVFVHDKIRDALLDRLPIETCKQLHFAAATHLETHAPSANFDLAYHYDEAGRSELALPYALQAADEARNCQAYEIAEEQYRIAQRGVRDADIEARFCIAEGLGEVTMMRGRYAEAADHFEATSKLATGDLRKATSFRKLGELAFRQGDIRKADRAFQQSLQLLGIQVPATAPALATRLARELAVRVWRRCVRRSHHSQATSREQLAQQGLRQLSHASWFGRSRVFTLWSQLAALNKYERFSEADELAEVYAEYAIAVSLFNWPSYSARFTQRALDIADQDADSCSHGKALYASSLQHLARARLHAAERDGLEAVRLVQLARRNSGIHPAQLLHAETLYRQGELKQAAEEAGRVYHTAIELGDKKAIASALSVWSRATNGGVPGDVIAEALRYPLLDSLQMSQLLVADAVRLLRVEKIDDATSNLEQAITLTKRIGLRHVNNSGVFTWYVTALRRKIEVCPVYQPDLRARLLDKAFAASRRAIRVARKYEYELPHVLRELGLLAGLSGRSSAAKRFLRKSMVLAEAQSARYELAKSRAAYGRLGRTFHWDEASLQMETAEEALRRIEPFYQDQLPLDSDESATLSLADRFENVLETGRRIASALSDENVYLEVHQATLRLLRGERSVILRVHEDDASEVSAGQLLQGQPGRLEPVAGDVDLPVRESMVWEAIRTGRGFSFTEATDNQTSSDVFANELSVVCAPVFVRGVPKACLYVTQGQVSGFFGDNEERLAGFIATLAGAALENADGFQQLQRLNESLEERVAERTAAAEKRARELSSSNDQLERTATELRFAQTELRRAKDAAVAASEAKSQFLAVLSHEIRTPLNGVIGMTELALTTELDTRQRGYLEVVSNSADSLLRLLNEVLDFSKIEAGKLELESLPFSVDEQVFAALQVAAGIAAQKRIELLYDVPADLPKTVIGDPARLRQVLINLVGNAIKFTEQGEISISVKILTQPTTDPKTESNAADGRADTPKQAASPSTTAPSLRLQFSVVDTGVGIPLKQQKKIFESFQQADSSTTRRYGGTGLGLSISSNLVSLMGGEIWVESDVGIGSAFVFTANFGAGNGAAPQAVPAQAALATNAGNPTPRKLLVVDENQDRAKIHRRWLEAADIEVQQVDSAGDGLTELIRAEAALRPFDGVLVDGHSYNDSGWDLVQSIRLESALDSCRVYLQVPAMPHDQVDICLQLDHVICLTKPVSKQTVLTEVTNAPTVRRTQPNPASQANDSNARILLAEDGEVNQMVAVGLLEMIGCRVDVVGDGEAAVNAWTAEKYDLILMDVEMPKMDGIQATRAIRECEAKEQRKRTPIVAMTAHAIAGYEQRCQEVGMDQFLPKPVEANELFRVIQQLTGYVAKTTTNQNLPLATAGKVSFGPIDDAIAQR